MPKNKKKIEEKMQKNKRKMNWQNLRKKLQKIEKCHKNLRKKWENFEKKK